MNIISSRTRIGFIAALETNYINTTGMCLELFFWPETEPGSPYRPMVRVLAITEERYELILASSSGYELEMWNPLFTILPSGVHKVKVEVRRSQGPSWNGMSIDDVVVQPCTRFGKTHPSVEIES